MIPAGLAAALRAEIAGSFVQGVDASDDMLLLRLRAPGRSLTLALSVAPGAVGAALLDERRTEAAGGLRSFRDHARNALAGARVNDVRQAAGGRFLVVGLGRAESTAELVLDASPRPNLAVVEGAQWHALRRPHEREGDPATWLREAADADPADPRDLPDLAEAARELLLRRTRLQARSRLLQAVRELRAGLSAARRLVARREQDVARLGEAVELRALADGLAAVLHEVKAGQSSVEVTRLDDGTRTVLPLDPRLPPGVNLRKRYGLAAKAERGEAMARRQLESARERLARIEECALRARSLAEALDEGEPGAAGMDVAAIHGLLRDCADVLPRRTGKAAEREERRRKGPALPEGIREWTSLDGLRILAGRSATSNDALTFRIARGKDVWLHARGVPGPHVVLVVPKAMEVPQQSLLDAATVAHVLGKLGAEPRGEVAWARAHDVRRVKGGPPGQVTVAHEKVVDLRVEPDRVARLGLRAGG